MTAPVVQSPSADRGWVIRFFMPSKWTMENLPTPNDDQVRLVTVPSETVAVLRFSGDRSPEAVAARIGELLKTLQDNGINPTGVMPGSTTHRGLCRSGVAMRSRLGSTRIRTSLAGRDAAVPAVDSS